MVSRTISRALRRPLFALAVGLAAAGGAQPAIAACDDLLPDPGRPRAAQRAVTAEDLLRLRDIGQPDGSSYRQPSPLAVSPNGREVAFILTRADADTNSYCRAVVIVPLAGGAPRRIADAGEMILNDMAGRGSMLTVGYVEATTPLWSPDGRWIAFLRRDDGMTRLWRVDSRGGTPVALSPAGANVEAFTFSADGDRLIFGTRPGLDRAGQEIDREARAGWLYDERIVPNMGARPRLPSGAPMVASAVDPASGTTLTGIEADQVQLDEAVRGREVPTAAAADGRRAWAAPEDDRPRSPTRLFAEAGGRRIMCAAASCDGGIFGVWWDEAGRELRFMRREGWAQEETVLYRWAPGAATPRAVLRTTDILLGCVQQAANLLCLREGSAAPRHLVRIDPRRGSSEPVWEPNPEFAALTLGTVERLRWRNAEGRAAWGDLVLPPGYRPGTRLPMVIVQYRSHGFLRGGTGNEYPIFAFAARGFAVLSVERAAHVADSVRGIASWDAFNAANIRNWTDRRSLLSSLLTGVNIVIDRGVADRARIGITGLSDGASTARFALINSDMFAAASISSCCMDAQPAAVYAGLAYARFSRRVGYPPLSQSDPDFWRPYSLALNAARMNRPLLMQLADAEYLLGLETFAALHEHGQPVELIVFPNEFHMKWQPAHRRAIYERNLDWFGFWLQDRVDPDPAKAAQYRRWEEMRTRRSSAASP